MCLKNCRKLAEASPVTRWQRWQRCSGGPCKNPHLSPLSQVQQSFKICISHSLRQSQRHWFNSNEESIGKHQSVTSISISCPPAAVFRPAFAAERCMLGGLTADAALPGCCSTVAGAAFSSVGRQGSRTHSRCSAAAAAAYFAAALQVHSSQREGQFEFLSRFGLSSSSREGSASVALQHCALHKHMLPETCHLPCPYLCCTRCQKAASSPSTSVCCFCLLSTLRLAGSAGTAPLLCLLSFKCAWVASRLPALSSVMVMKIFRGRCAAYKVKRAKGGGAVLGELQYARHTLALLTRRRWRWHITQHWATNAAASARRDRTCCLSIVCKATNEQARTASTSQARSEVLVSRSSCGAFIAATSARFTTEI